VVEFINKLCSSTYLICGGRNRDYFIFFKIIFFDAEVFLQEKENINIIFLKNLEKT